MLSQSDTAKLLARCAEEESPELAMEEVLSAYVAWKLIRGQSCELVLQKLRYFTIYLRVTNRGWILEIMREVLMVVATELSYGGGLIGACPVRTRIGKEAWNDFRRKLSSTPYAFDTDPEYGGPITFHGLRSIDEPRNPSRQIDQSAMGNITNANTTQTNATGPAVDSLASTFTTGTEALSSNRTFDSTRSTASGSSFSLFSRRRRRAPLLGEGQVRWSERPRWIRTWFLTRPHLAGPSTMLQMLAPEYRSLVPTYTSFRGTLPLYISDRSRSRT
ncbi:hypothetical protein GYMLUDRAFT_86720 [Collybiopsis luxurians FD-317 M1]|uniref:Uncharacterized protein n=1 Tax=Collybiopsis luxurians FD-317 M1 TaxID=944289 RepID=A0A0D0C512_9AGAR|nr:hypothetical protein GYMLUDRAFT_86720 [Collybiopsis luxurians FD-317 M1]